MKHRIRVILMLAATIGLVAPSSASAGGSQPSLTFTCTYNSAGKQVNARLDITSLRTSSIKSVTFFYSLDNTGGQTATNDSSTRTTSGWFLNNVYQDPKPSSVWARVVAGRSTYDTSMSYTCP